MGNAGFISSTVSVLSETYEQVRRLAIEGSPDPTLRLLTELSIRVAGTKQGTSIWRPVHKKTTDRLP